MADDAEKLLEEVKRLATARLKAANLAAKHAGLVLVDGKRLEKLEALLEAVRRAATSAKHMREYGDVLKNYPDEHYNGKRWLVRRQEGTEVMRIVSYITNNVDLPMGCFAD